MVCPNQIFCQDCQGDGIVLHEINDRSYFFFYCSCPLGQAREEEDAEARIAEMFQDQEAELGGES